MNILYDIKPVNNETLDCLEKAIVSVASWRSYHYEMMFLKSWRFNFIPKSETTTATIGERIDLPNDEKLQLLEKNHNIRLRYHTNLTKNELLDLIRNEIKEGRPATVNMDYFWCPWQKNKYQRESERQLCLIIDIDNIQNKLYCIDIAKYENENYIKCLPVSDFLNGCNVCNTFEFLDGGTVPVDLHQILSEPAANINSDMMKKLAEEVYALSNLNNECGVHKNENKIPLFVKLNDIAFGHMKFAMALEYLTQYHKKNELYIFTKELTELGWQWRMVRGMLIKAAYMREASNVIKRVSEKILNIAEAEKRLSDNILCQCGRN